MAFTEKPPILQGSAEDQIRALRDYLFRMAGSLETVITAPAVGTGTTVTRRRADGTVVTETGTAAKADTDAIRKSANELRALIIKHANELQTEIDTKVDEYDASLIAQSEIGTWELGLNSKIETSARGVLETYGLSENTISTINGDMQTYFTQMDGQIRRGFIENPDYPLKSTDEYIFGIAISSDLRFEVEAPRSDGTYDYYHLVSGQTFGFYTSSGWQFWVDGNKRGYYDSIDQKLHVKDIVADDSLQIGADWQIKSFPASHELEFVYVGGGT